MGYELTNVSQRGTSFRERGTMRCTVVFFNLFLCGGTPEIYFLIPKTPDPLSNKPLKNPKKNS